MSLNSGCYQSLHLFSSSFFLNFSNPSLMKYKENKTNETLHIIDDVGDLRPTIVLNGQAKLLNKYNKINFNLTMLQ